MTPPFKPADRRFFIGGSDARTIMGVDEGALLRLWREKRGEIEPQDLSGNRSRKPIERRVFWPIKPRLFCRCWGQ
jgi:hypothetical protein